MRKRFSASGVAGAVLVVLAGCSAGTDANGGAQETALAAPGTTNAATAPALQDTPVAGPERRILALGDSLFAGYGIGKENSYPAQLEQVLRAQGINARVTNAGVSGDTTAAGLQRLSFVLSNEPRKPDLAIVELGGNDLLRGLPPSETRANLTKILDQLKAEGIPVLLMGMRAPPNLGAEFVAEFDAIYPDLAKQKGAALVPFFQEAVYGKTELNQADRIHPTTDGITALVKATSEAVVKALPPAGSE